MTFARGADSRSNEQWNAMYAQPMIIKGIHLVPKRAKNKCRNCALENECILRVLQTKDDVYLMYVCDKCKAERPLEVKL